MIVIAIINYMLHVYFIYFSTQNDPSLRRIYFWMELESNDVNVRVSLHQRLMTMFESVDPPRLR